MTLLVLGSPDDQILYIYGQFFSYFLYSLIGLKLRRNWYMQLNDKYPVPGMVTFKHELDSEEGPSCVSLFYQCLVSYHALSGNEFSFLM